MAVTPTISRRLEIKLDLDGDSSFDPGLPVIAGESLENLFGPAQAIGQAGPLSLFSAEGWFLGAASMPVTGKLEETARRLYEDIFLATASKHLVRIWNYVPAINETGPDGLENYHAFCQGRSEAFERHFGPRFKLLLPSASAVGCQSDDLTVLFAASGAQPRHVESPLQMPAYHYPSEYGPRSPCFARATVVTAGQHAPAIFISGTAAIRGHTSLASLDIRAQLTCTLENLAVIFSQIRESNAALYEASQSKRFFKIYLRHAEDYPVVAAMLEEHLLTRSDRVTYVHADICRKELQIEIEATLLPSPSQPGPTIHPTP